MGSFFEDIKEKFRKAGETPAEEYYDEEKYDDYDEYDDYDHEEEFENSGYAENSSGNDNSSYSSKSAYDDYGYTPSSSKRSSAKYEPSASSDNLKYSRYGSTNIYKMNNSESNFAPKPKISKVIYFVLEDAEDARNIADCMIKNDSVILVDITKLAAQDAMRVLNFLDGVRYICKSSIETISNIQLIVPESVELTGDFFDQMSQGAFLG